MKKNIGAKLALYPTPLVVVGTMVNGKPNWTLVGHLGIIGHDRVMVSMSDSHYSNQGIRAMKTLSINIVDEAMLKEADFAGCVSGAKEDKSQLFAHHIADGGVPIVDAAPVSMACTVEDVYKTEGFESFICKIAATYAEESVLDDSGRLENTAYAKYFIGQSYLNPLTNPESGLFLANVTFEPGCRNNWHIHHAKKGGGQMLICTAGEGWYQEEGKAPVSLTAGTVITIPPEVKHWHGAKKDSWFSHIAVEVPGEDTSNEWCEPVTEKEYCELEER